MRLALLMIAAATAVTSASALTPAGASVEPKTALPVPHRASIVAFFTSDSHRQFEGDATLPAHRRPGPPESIVAIAAPHASHAPDLQTVALQPATEPATQAADPQDSRWQAFAPVAVTLMLIGAIALRRHQAEGS